MLQWSAHTHYYSMTNDDMHRQCFYCKKKSLFMKSFWKPVVKKHILAPLNGNWEAVVPVTDAAVRSLFKLKLPGIFYEMDSLSVCCYPPVFFFLLLFFVFFLSWSGGLKPNWSTALRHSPDKVICLTKCLLSKVGCFILAPAPLMECHWWYVRRRVRCECVCMCAGLVVCDLNPSPW